MEKITDIENEEKGFIRLLKERKKNKDKKKKPLTTERRKSQVKDWTTFYRRNWNIYAKHELDVPLHLYQEIWIYLMGVSQIFFLMCGRGLSYVF